MLCEVKDNAIKYLEKEGATNNIRAIVDRTKFDELNDKLTILAETKYGLDTQGQKLFDINISEQIDVRTSRYWRDDQVKIYRAIPNESLFNELQQLSRQVDNVESQPNVNVLDSGRQKRMKAIYTVFETNPVLYQVGTPEQYESWINYQLTEGKLKGTKATEIVFHGTDREFDTFDKTKRGETTGKGYFKDEQQTPVDSLNAFFFSNNDSVAVQYGLINRIDELSNLYGLLSDINMAIDFDGSIIGNIKEVRKQNPKLADHLNQKKEELSGKDFKAYVMALTDKYRNTSDKIKKSRNRLENYITFGKQLESLRERKGEILNGRYKHDSVLQDAPDLPISIYKNGNQGLNIYSDGNIDVITSNLKNLNDKNITELTSKEFDDLIAEGIDSYEQGMNELGRLFKEAKVTPIMYSVLLNIQNPLEKDFEGQSFVAQMGYDEGAQLEASRLTDEASKSKEYDGVKFENISDPFISNNYGVFEPEQVYMLGGKEDIKGFTKFVNGPAFMKLDPFLNIEDYVPLIDLNLKQLGDTRSRRIAQALSEKLALSMQMNYQNVTPEEAGKILENTSVPYNGEAGFYFAGTIYTVGENVNVNTVLHEFSHPLLQAIRKDNKKLFDNLYDQAMATEEGVGIAEHVRTNYPELNEDSDLFKEEVLAYALQLKSFNQVLNQVETNGFQEFIKKLLASIKKMLRNIFGQKIKVSKLNQDTTLNELATMMLEKDFDLGTPDITEEDLVMYARMVNERAQDLVNHTNVESLQEVIETDLNVNLRVLNDAKNFKSDKRTKKMLKETLFQKGTTKLLPSVTQSLRDFVDFDELKEATEDEKIQEVLEGEERRAITIKNKSQALINSFDTINTISKNMLKDLAKIQSDPSLNNRHTVALMFLYKNTARAWLGMLKDIDTTLMENGQYTDTNNLFYQTLNEITNNITRINSQVAKILLDNNVQWFVEITGYMNEFVNDRFKSNLNTAFQKAFKNPQELEKAIEDTYNKVTTQQFTDQDVDALVKKGVPRNILESFIKEYRDYVVNEDKIKAALTGNAHDVSFFNRWLESYSSSNDVIVGPLSIFIQDQRTEVENEVWKKSMSFRKKLADLLPKVNFSKMNTFQMRELLGEKDTVMFFDKESGEPVAKEIYVFLNEFGNGWRFEQDVLEFEVEKARQEGDLTKLAEARQKLQQFNNDYMWQEYVPEYYERQQIFQNSAIGKLAYTVRQEKLQAFNNLQNQFDNELERLEAYPSIQAAWREYQQLYSLQYEDGTDKIDDPEKGIYDKSIAETLRESREGTQFREMIPVPGSLQLSYNEFLNQLEGEGITKGSGEFIEKLDHWKRQNLKVKYTDEYWKSRNELFEELAMIDAKIKNKTFDVGAAYKEISNLIFAYKDAYNQPISNEMGTERLRRIKELQQQILDYQRESEANTGLTTEQAEELRNLSRMNNRGEITPGSAQADRFIYLSDLQEDIGLTAEEQLRRRELFAELGSMTDTLVTDYYMDTLNYNLSKQNVKEIQANEVEDFINSEEFQELLQNDTALLEWFELNHVEKTFYNKKAKALDIKYMPTAANVVKMPSNPEHIETTTITDTATGEEVTLLGVPSARHSRFEVKNEFRTIPFGEDREQYVGKYIDNKGNWLPRKFGENEEYSAKDDRFISQRFKQISSNKNSAEYQLLEAMTEFHLEMQKGMSNYGKLYMDMPRYATKTNDIYQKLQRGKYGERFKDLKAGLKNFFNQEFGKSKVDFENDLNYNPENNLVNTDLNGEQVSYIPITGIYNLDLDITDSDVISTMFRYALSIQTQGKLLESLPLVESLLDTLENPENQLKELDTFSKNQFNLKNKLQAVLKKGATNNRLGQVRSLIEREYYGKQVAGLEENHPMMGKILQKIQGFSSWGSLVLNIPADLKNQISGYVQTIIESTGGDFITSKDLALATPWATKAMLEWTRKGIYGVGPGAMSTQLIQIFDPAFKTTDEFGREVMRSMVKDLTNMEWTFMHRKFGEMDVAVKLFGSFLHGQKVTQILSDGTEKSLRYVDAWEKDEEGIIKLKEGVHPGWNNVPVYHNYTEGESLEQIAKKYYISVDELKAKNRIKSEIQLEDGQEIVIAKSEKFKGFKNKLQGTSRRLFGVYDRMGAPEGNKYVIYRLFFFMRKWFTPMFVNRFGFDPKTATLTDGGYRYDWALGKYTKGYYISAFQTLVKLIKSKGADYQYLTDQEKGDFRRFASEGLATIALALIASMLLGFDPDDEDKWKKLKRRSGAYGTESYKTYGFLTNHMLLLTLGVQAETTAFIPLPRVAGQNFGLDDYTKMITSTSSAWYNTTTLYAQIFGDILSFISGNGLPEYQKDTGPYWWQQKGEAKLYKKIFKAVGFTGGTGDPVTVLKNLEGSSTRFS